jgi:hypothetical protein
MIGFNASYALSDARSYVEQLFGRTQSTPADNTGPQPASWDASSDNSEGLTHRDQAINKIISLIWTMQHGGEQQQSAINQTGGYILDAQGTDEADEINMKAISAFNVDLGGGDDTINLKAGSLAALQAGDGADTLNLTARYLAEIDGGEGDDAITMAGDIVDGVDGNAGDDVLKVSGRAILNLTGGAGNDTIQLVGERIFAAGGAGDDTISITSKGARPAELSFATGDGKDTVTSNGPLDIRFTASGYGQAMADALTPDQLEVTASDGALTIRARGSDDAITISFTSGALQDAAPSYSFVLDNGDYVLNIR